MSSLAEKMYQRCSDGMPSQASPSTPRNPALATRPAFLTCYLCGQGFGTSSLKIHQPQCYIKKLLQWEKGDAAIRGPRPVHPDERTHQTAVVSMNPGGAGRADGKLSRAAIDSFNNAQFTEFNEKSLVPCENCGRTFFPDRLQVHLRSCKPGSSARPVVRRSQPTTAATQPPPPQTQRLSGSGDGSLQTKVAPPSTTTAVPALRQLKETVAYEVDFDDRVVGGRGGSDFGGKPADFDEAPPHMERPSSNGSSDEEGGDMNMLIAACAGDPVDAVDVRSVQSSSPIPKEGCGGGFVDPNDDDVPTMSDDMGIAGGTFAEDAPVAPRRPKMQIHRPMDLSKALASRPSIFAGGGAAAEQSLKPCQYCRRTFAPDRIEKHESVCTEKKAIVVTKGTPRRAMPATGNQVVGPLHPGTVPGSVRASGGPLNVSSTVRRRGGAPTTPRSGGGVDPMRRSTSPSLKSSTDRSRTPTASQTNRSTTPRGGSQPNGSIVNGVATYSARPAATVARQLPGDVAPGATATRQPQRISPEGCGYASASLAQQPPPPESSTTTSTAIVRPKFCTECGTRMLSGAQKFCGECGHKVCDM